MRDVVALNRQALDHPVLRAAPVGIVYLSEVELTAGEITGRFQMSQPSVSKHLAILENSGLIWRKRVWQFIRYGLRQDTLSSALGGFLREACPPPRL